jgi:hypothetical protein
VYRVLAKSCLQLMFNLKKDICDLCMLSALVSKVDNSWVKQCLLTNL